MPQKPRASVVELIAPDYTPAEDGAGSIVVPRDVRINGVSVYTAGDGIVRIGHVHLGNELVTVNLTLAVRRLVIAAESEAAAEPTRHQGDKQTSELVDAHERSRLALCDALLLSRDTTWHQLIEQAGERQREAAHLCRARDRVRDLPEHPDIMDAKHAEPNGYLHGYRIAIRDAKRAVETGG